jgi:nitroreductase
MVRRRKHLSGRAEHHPGVPCVRIGQFDYYCEDEIKALLGLRPEVSTYALMPIGYPRGKFRPLARKPVSEVAYADRWGRRVAELVDGRGSRDQAG